MHSAYEELNMYKVPQTTPAPKAFFCQFDQEPGILVKPGKELLFFNTDTRQYVTLTPANIHLLVRLGEVSKHMAMYYEDMARAREERLTMTAASKLAA
jgi:hypothetical protein